MISVALRGGVAAFALALYIHGSTKRPAKAAVRTAATAEVTDADIARGWRLVSVTTNAAIRYNRPEHGTRYRNWWLRGGYEDRFWLDPGGFRFPFGSNDWSRFSVSMWGEIRPVLRDRLRTIAATGCPMSAVPQRSEFWWAAESDGSRVLTWRNFALNRDTNTPVNAQIVLFPNGDFVTRSNEVERTFVRVEPFDWDGDGIPNADDPNPRHHDGDRYGQSAERRAWVAAQVGTNERNGLYRLRATFPNNPPRRTLLTVGTNRVVVIAAGDYDFLLEKGEEYAISTEPFVAAVRYSADDGTGGVSTQIAAPPTVGQWSVAGGDLRLVNPTSAAPGRVLWMPTLTATPGLAHLGPGAPDPVFTAVLSDFPYAERVAYRWSGGSPDVVVVAPNARTTPVRFGDLPSWRECAVSVCATFGTNRLTSVLSFSYGTNATPQVHLGLSVPRVVLLNDGTDAARLRPLLVSFSSDVPTNGTVSLSCVRGGERVSLWQSAARGYRIDGDRSWDAADFGGFTAFVEGVAASESVGDVGFVAAFMPGAGGAVTNAADLTVAEVLGVNLLGAPEDGLVVMRGTSVALEAECRPSGAGDILASTWQVRRMRGDGGYGAWQFAAGNYGGTRAAYRAAEGGIYQVRALVTPQDGGGGAAEVRYTWADGEDPAIGVKRRGDPKAFGVVDAEWQKRLRDCARSYIGSTDYSKNSFVSGDDQFSSIQWFKWKCSTFVALRIKEAGLTVPTQRTFRGRNYPPSANDWANGVRIRNWHPIGKDGYPQPGFVVGHPSSVSSGHCGIMDFDGQAIAAGEFTVNRRYAWWNDGTSGYNYYSPEEDE